MILSSYFGVKVQVMSMDGIPEEQGIDPNDLVDLQGRWGQILYPLTRNVGCAELGHDSRAWKVVQRAPFLRHLIRNDASHWFCYPPCGPVYSRRCRSISATTTGGIDTRLREHIWYDHPVVPITIS